MIRTAIISIDARGSGAMRHSMRYPRWQQPLEAAILEFDPPHLRAKLDRVAQAISDRLQELSSDLEITSREEVVALGEELTIVRILEKHRMLML